MNKLQSARFWIALLMTINGCMLTIYCAVKNLTFPTEYNTIWGVVITFYFLKNRDNKNGL